MVAGKDAAAPRRGQELLAHRHGGLELRGDIPVPPGHPPRLRRPHRLPCMGTEIGEFTVTRKCRGATYKIQVKNTGTHWTSPKLVVDGQAIEGKQVPMAPAGVTVNVRCEV